MNQTSDAILTAQYKPQGCRLDSCLLFPSKLLFSSHRNVCISLFACFLPRSFRVSYSFLLTRLVFQLSIQSTQTTPEKTPDFISTCVSLWSLCLYGSSPLLSPLLLTLMDAAKLDYTLTASYSPSSRYTEKAIIKNQESQILFSVSAVSSQLESNSFDLSRNFGPLSIPQHTQPSYPYPRPCDILLSPDQHSSPFPRSQEAPLADVNPYIYDSGSSYPSNPQPSQPSFQISSALEPFHLNVVNQDLTAQSISLSIDSALDLAVQTPATPFSSAPLNYNLLRRYHEDQSRQHAQVLQQLTRSRDGRRQSPAEDFTGNGVFSASLEITPTGRRAELYHATSSIPMSNIRPHQPRPPEHTLQQTKPFNHYQYPYYHNQDLGYLDNCRSEPLDVSSAHVLTTQGIRVRESTQEPTSTFHVSTKTMQILSPSADIALDSGLFAMRSAPRSNVIQSMPHPTTRAFDGVPEVGKVHPSTMASISSPFLEDTPSGIAKEGSQLIEIRSENGDETKLKIEARTSKEDGMESIAGNYPGTNAKRRDGRQSEVLGSSMAGRPRAADSVIKDGLSPPTKKRKKSKMHECQVCHKNFPRFVLLYQLYRSRGNSSSRVRWEELSLFLSIPLLSSM